MDKVEKHYFFYLFSGEFLPLFLPNSLKEILLLSKITSFFTGCVQGIVEHYTINV